MRLYHFAPEQLIESILSEGLTLGKIPVLHEDGTLTFRGPCQWLTKDGDWNNQSWATQQLITYDRTAYRLQISIPKAHRHLLINAYDYLPQLPVFSKSLITDWKGSENWYLFSGRIPRGWIRKVEQKPTLGGEK